jgi:N-acetylglucosaminyldiphosphoundecaprenol N-acetyl-beta-D-mannosaminyltransferase
LSGLVTVVTQEQVLARIGSWAAEGESRYICFCNVHSIVSTTQDDEFRKVVNEADMALADGKPIAWTMRLRNLPQSRIAGPDLMLAYLARAAARGEPVFFLGSTEETLARLRASLSAAFPTLNIAGMCSPPFRTLSEEEDAEIVSRINESGARVLFVGLGCPKQEKWMAAHRGSIRAVMLGVGAAFDYHAGTLKRAPGWMQDLGLEWLHRLCSDPARLWKRYLVTNLVFMLSSFQQSLRGERRYAGDSGGGPRTRPGRAPKRVADPRP